MLINDATCRLLKVTEHAGNQDQLTGPPLVRKRLDWA
jgi:hypothetical protein